MDTSLEQMNYGRMLDDLISPDVVGQEFISWRFKRQLKDQSYLASIMTAWRDYQGAI